MAHRCYKWIRQGLSILLGIAMRCFNLARRQIGGGSVLVKQGEVYYIPLWLPLALGLLLAFVAVGDDVAQLAERISSTAMRLVHQPGEGELADFFAPSVQYWSGKIHAWAAEHQTEPQLLATVMQIESCGHPKVVSSAGARGLFQVMPFHFTAGEDMLDPDTNARRGSAFLNDCYRAADGVIGLTLACYNGGPAAIHQSADSWAAEIQRYYRWGVGIYSDAMMNRTQSDIFDQWMQAGGSHLCASALSELDSYSPP